MTLAASAAPPDSATKTRALETTARELAENQRTLERAPGSQTRFIEASQVAQAVENCLFKQVPFSRRRINQGEVGWIAGSFGTQPDQPVID